MDTILRDAQEQHATDILLINGGVWFRVSGKLQPTEHTASGFNNVPIGFELKSTSHIRCLPTGFSLSALQYPGEVSTVLDFERGLIILNGTNNSGKTTLLLHWLQSLQHRSVDNQIQLPNAGLNKVLWSSDQADIQLTSITDGTSALNALRDSIHQLVIAVVDARNNADALRHIHMLLCSSTHSNDSGDNNLLSLMSEQICSVVNVSLIRTVQQRFRPLVAITNRNEGICAQISHGDFDKLEDAVQRGNGGLGSLSSDVQLASWLQQRQIHLEEALRFANYPATMRLRASGIIHND